MYRQKIPPELLSVIFSDVQKSAKNRLEKKWLPIFMSTPQFKKRHADCSELEIRRATIKVCVFGEGNHCTFMHHRLWNSFAWQN